MSRILFDFSSAPGYQQAMDYTGSPDGVQPVYIGWATPGSAITDKAWMIRKFSYAANSQGGYSITNIQYANGDVGFKNAWNTTPGSVVGSTFSNAGVVFK